VLNTLRDAIQQMDHQTRPEEETPILIRAPVQFFHLQLQRFAWEMKLVQDKSKKPSEGLQLLLIFYS
jgi:hypothetical protein